MLNKYDFQADNIFEKSEDYTYGGTIDYTISDKSALVASIHTDHYNRYDKYELKSGRRLEYKNNIIQPRVVYTTTALDKQTITGGLEFYRESLFSDKFETGVKRTKANGMLPLSSRTIGVSTSNSPLWRDCDVTIMKNMVPTSLPKLLSCIKYSHSQSASIMHADTVHPALKNSI